MTQDTYSYKGWMQSDKLLKRSFAVYGHALVAGLCIAIPLYLIIFVTIFLPHLIGIAPKNF